MHRLTLAIVLNVRSADGDDADLQARIGSALEATGVGLQWFVVHKPVRLGAVCATAAAQADRLVIAGGDGSVRIAAQAARNAGKPLAIIPTGTYNYVARRLGIPLDIEAAAQLAGNAPPRPVACGEINGQVFFNHAAFGLYTRIIAARERHTALLGRSRVTAVLSGIATLFNRYPILRLRLLLDGETRQCRASAVFFGANPLQLTSVDSSFASRCADTGLGMVLMRHQPRRRVLLAAVRALIGRLAQAQAFDLQCVTRATVDVARRRRRLRVSLDGEITVCPLPLHIRYLPDAVHIVTPEPT
ncbi:MAG: NAD(+)/NADH kinase [Rhodocyclaceae bacterium]|nr:NAD(+)/NADH kinase [Rhodocyclaceae bacterium]